MTSTVPDYVTVPLYERGTSFNVSFQEYKFLARTGLGIIDNIPVEMGIYPLPLNEGCRLDIWGKDCLVTIEVNSALGQIKLLSCSLDSIADPACILFLSSTEENWRTLGAVARKELTQ